MSKEQKLLSTLAGDNVIVSEDLIRLFLTIIYELIGKSVAEIEKMPVENMDTQKLFEITELSLYMEKLTKEIQDDFAEQKKLADLF